MPCAENSRSATVDDRPGRVQIPQLETGQEVTRVALARGPPLWGAADAEHDPAADPLLPPIPVFEFDQRLPLKIVA